MADNHLTDLKRGDLKPDLVYTAYDKAQLADLTQVVSWRLIAVDGITPAFIDTSPTVAVPNSAEKWRVTLTHLWQTAETATVRDLKIEAEATWPGGKPQTFPAVKVQIKQDLG